MRQAGRESRRSALGRLERAFLAAAGDSGLNDRETVLCLFRGLFLSLARQVGLEDRARQALPGSDGSEPRFDLRDFGPLSQPFSLEDAFLFGALHERLLAHGSRKRSGSFYTPAEIVRRMVSEALDHLPGEDPRLLDPAMGSGHFLVGAVEHLSRQEPSARRADLARDRVFGVDQDPLAVETARLSLLLFCLDGEGPLPDFHEQLQEGEAIFSLPPEEWRARLTRKQADARARALHGGARSYFFHWPLAFPEVFAEGGFSVVLGNPPYGDLLSPEDKDALPRFGFFPTGGRAEIYAPFLQQGLRLLRPGGRLSYILPNTLLDGRQFGKLRAGITRVARVQAVTDFSRERVFKEASVFAMILQLEKTAAAAGEHEAVYCRPGRLPDQRLRIHGGEERPWRCVDTRVEALRRDDQVQDLSPHVADCFDAGLDYKYKDVGWGERGKRPSLSARLTYTGPRRHPLDKLLVRGKDLTPFRLRSSDTYLIHDWQKIRGPGRVVQVYPERAEVPVKILTRQTSDCLVAALDRSGRYTAKSVHTVIVTNPGYTPEFVCALLNSRAMNRIYKTFTNETGRPFAQVKVSDLRVLPVWKGLSYARGLAHPAWVAHREHLRSWIRTAEVEPLLDFTGTHGDLHQVVVTELVRRLETVSAQEEALFARLVRVLDRLFDRLYGAAPVSDCNLLSQELS